MSAAEEMFGMKTGRRVIRTLKRKEGKVISVKTLIVTKPSVDRPIKK